MAGDEREIANYALPEDDLAALAAFLDLPVEKLAYVSVALIYHLAEQGLLAGLTPDTIAAAGEGRDHPSLRFQIVTNAGDTILDELIGPDHTDAGASAERHAEIAAAHVKERGEAVTLIVRDPDLDDAVVHIQRVEPTTGDGRSSGEGS